MTNSLRTLSRRDWLATGLLGSASLAAGAASVLAAEPPKGELPPKEANGIAYVLQDSLANTYQRR